LVPKHRGVGILSLEAKINYSDFRVSGFSLRQSATAFISHGRRKVEKVLDVRLTAGVPYQRWITKGYAKRDLYLLLHLLLRAIGAQASSL
jgi:hypothetical protein